MSLDKYTQKIVTLFSKAHTFSFNELVNVEFLKGIGNNPEQLMLLNQYMENGDSESIKNFIAEERKTTYDDYSYLMIKLKTKNFMVCIWDSDELWDDPILVSFKEIQHPL